ncbi:WD40 repeat domain-containing protein [Streptomyces qinglanensis]|uniref:WD40 repeat n=1 Tax=Streptomyces qinglanensis TaxID=943816 RepID=A0A1H9WV24_9ACTN|nr:WD40 repeat domain-containing protein [Streptomyces qinglanensis]SES37641.1 WD40 repeat [Streptomyces qinglanensis]
MTEPPERPDRHPQTLGHLEIQGSGGHLEIRDGHAESPRPERHQEAPGPGRQAPAVRPADSHVEIQQKLAAALADLVPDDPSIPPHPYLRRHLAQHAAQGHVLDDTHVPPALLPWETSAAVRRLLAAGESSSLRQQWLQAWAKLEPFTRDLTPLSRLASLQLAHHAATARHLPPERRGNPPEPFAESPVTPLWSDCASAENLWALTDPAVTSLTSVTPRGPRRTLVVAGDDHGAVRLLRPDGTAAAAPLALHQGAVTHLLPLADGLVVTAGTDGRVTVLDAHRARPIRQIHHRERAWVTSLIRHEQSEHAPALLAAYGDGHIAAFDAATFQPADIPLPVLESAPVLLQSTRLPGPADPPRTECGSPVRGGEAAVSGPPRSGTPVLLFAQHDTVGCFDGRTTARCSRHPAAVRALLALPDRSGRYAVALEDGSLALHDAAAPQLRLPAPTGTGPDTTQATALQVVEVENRQTLASASADGTVRLWELPALRPLHLALPGHSAPATALTAVTRDGHTRLYSAGLDSTIRTWPLSSAALQNPPPVWTPITASALSPPPMRLLATAEEARTKVWNIETGAEQLVHEGDSSTALAWVPLGTRLLLAAGMSDSSVVLWDLTEGGAASTVRALTGHYSPALCLVPMIDDATALLAGGGADGRVLVWDLSTGRTVHSFSQHVFSVRCLASVHSRHGFLLASGGSDGNVRIWDLRRPPREAGGGHRSDPVTIRCEQHAVNDVAFFPLDNGGLRLATAGQDGSLKVWSVREGQGQEPVPGRQERSRERSYDGVDLVREFNPGDGELTAVTRFTDGRGRTVFAVAGRTGIHLWDATVDRPLLQAVTGYPVNTLKMAPQRASESVAPVLLATGEAGTMILRLDDKRL